MSTVANADNRPVKHNNPKKRNGLFSRIRLFMRQVVAELRKVIWPTHKEMITYTTTVLVFLAIMMAIIVGLDFVFGKAMFALFS